MTIRRTRICTSRICRARPAGARTLYLSATQLQRDVAGVWGSGVTEPEPEVRVVIVMPERFGLPFVPSDRVRCYRCGASCWLSKRATGYTGALCLVCATAVVKSGDILSPAPWAGEDLADADDA